jgi:hypothetical protein
MAMVFNTTFNNISVISWRSVLLMEETGVPFNAGRVLFHSEFNENNIYFPHNQFCDNTGITTTGKAEPPCVVYSRYIKISV